MKLFDSIKLYQKNNIKRFFIPLFFLLFSTSLFAQNFTTTEIDSLNQLDFATITSNASYYEKLFLRVFNVSDSLNYTNGKAGASVNLSILYSVLGEMDTKVEYRLKAIRFYEEIDSLKQVGYQYAELGWGLRISDLSKSEEYMRQGLSILSNFPGSSEQASAFNNYGSLKIELEELDSAFYFINQSLNIKKELNDTIGVAYSYSYLSNVYQTNEDFENALIYLDSAIVLRETINDVNGISIDLVNSGLIYQSLGDLETANEYLKRSLSSALEIGYVRLAEFAYNAISDLFLELNKPDSALVYYKMYIQFKDSVSNIETNQRIAELEIQFQTEEKEKELAQRTAQLSLEQLRVKRRNWITGIFGTLFLSVSLISFLVVRQQRIRRENIERENELKLKLADVESENKIHKERERISRDLHDNVGSQITNLITGIEISNLHIKKNQQDKALSLLGNLDSDARSAMTDLRETIWLLDKQEVEFESFLEHLKGYIKRQESYLKGLKTKIKSSVDAKIVLNPTQSINLTRVIQEALNNTRKYANASKFNISFSQKGEKILITLSDDGIGMEVHNNLEKGNGLRNMKERVKEIGGSFSITSSTENGTEIKLEL
ncbi:MAG: histidine kinase [Balneolaceae bacterium]